MIPSVYWKNIRRIQVQTTTYHHVVAVEAPKQIHVQIDKKIKQCSKKGQLTTFYLKNDGENMMSSRAKQSV